MKCGYCQSEGCKPKVFHLCLSCNGEGCATCADSIIPGILEGELEDGGNLMVCSDWQDPEIEAAMFDTRKSLIEALESAKARMIEELG
jgi:hypothetical protein